jgi:hypothetical protein
MMSVISVPRNARGPIWVTVSVADSDGKKTDEGTMMWRPEPSSNSVAFADPPEVQTLTPATTEEASDILINCKMYY